MRTSAILGQAILAQTILAVIYKDIFVIANIAALVGNQFSNFAIGYILAGLQTVVNYTKGNLSSGVAPAVDKLVFLERQLHMGIQPNPSIFIKL